MIIKNLKFSESNNRYRISAEVSYEDFHGGMTEVYFEVPSQFKDYLKPSYEAFLFSCFPAALYHQEKRIRIEGDICPEVLANVKAAMLLQKQWFEHEYPVPAIESLRERIQYPVNNGLAGCFLSGGVDSLSNFSRNVSTYPPDHIKRFKTAICVFGMDVGDPNQPLREDIFDQTIDLLSKLTTIYGCEMLPVYTNARKLEMNWRFYADRHFGPLLAGIAHSLGNRLISCSIALDNRVDYYVPRGSHPSLNKYFFSSFLSVESPMDAYLRIEKYQFLKKVPESLKALRVCYTIRDIAGEMINCGKCSKCIRTKLELFANGLLEQTRTFPNTEISKSEMVNLTVSNALEVEFVHGLISYLESKGEVEFVRILRKNLENAKYDYSPLPKRILNFIKKIDKTFFDRAILKNFRRFKRWRNI